MYNLAALEFTLNRKSHTWITCYPDQWPDLAEALGEIGYSWASGENMGKNPFYPYWNKGDVCFVRCYSRSKECTFARNVDEDAIPCEHFLTQEDHQIDIQQFKNLI